MLLTTIQLKILWKENIFWNDTVMDPIYEACIQFRSQMEHLAGMKIPGYVSEGTAAKYIQLVGLCNSY